MKWQKLAFPVYISNHWFKHGNDACLRCGARFKSMVSADAPGFALYWNGVGRVDDSPRGLPPELTPAKITLNFA